MDVRQYFRKIREIEATLVDEFPVMVSVETADGGKAGLFCEMTRANAARMIVDGRGALATAEQIDEFRAQQEAIRKAAERAEMSKRIQVAILSDPELHGVPSGKRNGK